MEKKFSEFVCAGRIEAGRPVRIRSDGTIEQALISEAMTNDRSIVGMACEQGAKGRIIRVQTYGAYEEPTKPAEPTVRQESTSVFDGGTYTNSIRNSMYWPSGEIWEYPYPGYAYSLCDDTDDDEDEDGDCDDLAIRFLIHDSFREGANG